MKVLIIDDDRLYRQVLRAHLSGMPAVILEAGTGIEGLRRAFEESPDVIFLDLGLPDFDGQEVLEALRESRVTRRIPIVLHSARKLDKAEQEALPLGSFSVLPKEKLHGRSAQVEIRAALREAGVPGAR